MTLGLGAAAKVKIMPVTQAIGHPVSDDKKSRTLRGLMFRVHKTVPVSHEPRLEQGP